MRYIDVAAPLGLLWSSPFTKWQGRLGEVSSLDLAVAVTRRALRERDVAPEELASVVLGLTIPQEGSFFGAPTVAAQLGASGITGAMINQACATAVACVQSAASTVVVDGGTHLIVTTDRTSNGPNIVYPAPSAAGGSPRVENLVQQNFALDPWAGTSMLAAGETVAAELGVSREELDDLAVLRYEQYTRALDDNRAFQRRYMVPVELPARRGATTVVEEDEGIRPMDRDALTKLSPAQPGGVHTGASQTHPADGTAGMVVTTTQHARDMSGGNGIVEILASGFARVEPTHMPQAPVPAAQVALADAGLDIGSVDAITTHNPFAVNDVYFARAMGVPIESMNSFGSSLIWGHPQAPTGLRSLAELVTQLQLRGGGVGLFTGCAAGDTAGALVVRVGD
ncbi:thiolase family protein [Streptomyces sp. NPDC056983]|uniref:thiolase family protein n=1 Tax=Streptomyces sp. NPDC056983 TaxID=3345987 RepID=UPI00362C144E